MFQPGSVERSQTRAGYDDVWDSCLSIVKRHTWRLLNRTTRVLSGGIAPRDPVAGFAAEPQAWAELR
jgi:hypothetical protein